MPLPSEPMKDKSLPADIISILLVLLEIRVLDRTTEFCKI
jgi:hypothetical protein